MKPVRTKVRRNLCMAVLAIGLGGCVTRVEPLTPAQHLAFADTRLAAIAGMQEPITGSVTLYQAMARALKYNLDARVEVMESAVRVKDLDLAAYQALPSFVAGSGYAGRNLAETSTPSLRDEDVLTRDLSLTWNVLDFGLSYVRSKQAADEVLIQEEMKRKIVNRIMEDVRTAYWRTASYERLVARMRELDDRVKGAVRGARALSGSGDASPMEALTYERDLLGIQREMEGLEGDLVVAKAQLAALMNVTPGSVFTLDPPRREMVEMALPEDMAALYRIAAANRPELHEIAYRKRINDRDIDVALLELLPNFNLYGGPNYDSNEFIATNDWISWGSKVSWNAMKLLAMPDVKERIAAKDDLLEERALSVAMAVVTQVHVSRLRYRHLHEAYGTAGAVANVQHRILRQIASQAGAERTSDQLLVREEMNTLVADAAADMVHAELQNAYANVYASLGIDPFPAGMRTDRSIDAIAADLSALWQERERPFPLIVAER